MKRLLANIGGFLAISGIISTILYLIDYEVSILAWIDSGGPMLAWVIRISLIVIGVLLFFLVGKSSDDDTIAEEDN
jgi:hypothetical protein